MILYEDMKPIEHVLLYTIHVRYHLMGFGVNPPPLELDTLQNFSTCAKAINCFRILFAS